MEELKDKVIVLKSFTSKEKDKMVLFFSLTKGVIKANLKGVLNPNAKLKYLAQPFCFAEVNLVFKNGFYTVINAYPIETFFNLTSDYDKFNDANSVLEVLSTFTLNESAYPKIFVSALKSFKFMEFENANSKIALIKFMLDVFQEAGYGFGLDKCSECGAKILTEPYFDLDSGNILCLACKNQFSIKLNQIVLTNLKIINKEDYDNLKTIKIVKQVENELLSLLKQAFKSKFNYILKSL